MNTCPNCGMVKGLHASILPGCMCPWTPQEPAAWISQNAGLYHGKPDESLNALPLYLAPPPCPTCEALARTVMLDQTSHDTQRKPLTNEQERALCEAYCNDASDEYFKARPALDFPEMRRIFYAGHRKAWINYEAAHGIKEVKSCGS